ncbi:hypothetical protein E2562_009367 [Oryza meyeriana var. granulata]|uniref:Uncharacterized protein n=1 Tax=Oryza meyeriana var. granulata TaxID=110450 RepID=A0A6G1CF13_9ORYZ|nr:hypothetical protein E2562_009367 [Oryza meyeriana var. granulata]
MDFIWPVPPATQPVGDSRVAQLAQLAVFVAANEFISQTYLRYCPCGVRCFQDDAGQGNPQLANFVTAMLGLVLVLGQVAFSRTVFRSQTYVTVAQWLISIAKVDTVGTIQRWLSKA